MLYGSDLSSSSDVHRKSNLNTIADCIRDGSEAKPAFLTNSASSSEIVKKPVDVKPAAKVEVKPTAPVTVAKPVKEETKEPVETPAQESKPAENKFKDTSKKPQNNIASMFNKQRENPQPKKYTKEADVHSDASAATTTGTKSSSSSESISSISKEVKKENKEAKELREIIDDLDVIDEDVIVDTDDDEVKKKKEKIRYAWLHVFWDFN